MAYPNSSCYITLKIRGDRKKSASEFFSLNPKNDSHFQILRWPKFGLDQTTCVAQSLKKSKFWAKKLTSSHSTRTVNNKNRLMCQMKVNFVNENLYSIHNCC